MKFREFKKRKKEKRKIQWILFGLSLVFIFLVIGLSFDYKRQKISLSYFEEVFYKEVLFSDGGWGNMSGIPEEVNGSFYCEEFWICDDWGECDGEEKFRECRDINNCEKKEGVPDLKRKCSETLIDLALKDLKKGDFTIKLILVILAFFIMILVFILIVYFIIKLTRFKKDMEKYLEKMRRKEKKELRKKMAYEIGEEIGDEIGEEIGDEIGEEIGDEMKKNVGKKRKKKGKGKKKNRRKVRLKNK
jgi:uncharacterized membrane protein